MTDTLEKSTEIQEPEAKESDLDFLLHHVNVTRAREGKTAPKAALYAMLEYIERKHWYGYRRSWEILIDVMADRLGIIAEPWKYALPGVTVRYDNMIKQGWIKQKKTQYPDLAKHFKQSGMMEEYLAAAQRDPWDHLGDIFEEQQLAGRHNMLGQMLTPKNIVDFMVKIMMPDKIEKLQTVMEPAVGTGRFLIEMSLLNPKAPLILFGVEIDVTLYRACLVNMALFSKHPYVIICANTLMLDNNRSGPASELWNRGNIWEPIDVTDFYWKPAPITSTRFSLSHFTNETLKALPVPDKKIETPSTGGYDAIMTNPPFGKNYRAGITST